MSVRSIEKKARTPAIWTLLISLIISLSVLIIYILQSGFQDKSDETLFFFLAFLRYSSFMVCICSVYLLAFSIYRIIRKPSVISIVQIILYLCSALYGAGIMLIDAFILSITAGNV